MDDEIAERATRRGADQALIRGQNLATVADFVRGKGRCSRREISEQLHLNKGTVTGLVNELIFRGLLEERDQRTGGLGRPSRFVQPDTATHASIVAEILPGRALVSTWTLTLERLGLRTVHFDTHDAEPALKAVRRSLVDLVSSLQAKGRVVTGVVAALPGLVNVADGQLVRSAPLHWADVPVRTILQRARAMRDLPVLVGRVASLATVAESRALPQVTDMICLHGGETGIGAGVITGAHLLTGAQGRAGELLFPARRESGAQWGATLGRLIRPAVSVAGHAELERLGTEWGRRLGTLIALLDPEMVVLAGHLAPVADHLDGPVRAGLREAFRPDPAPGIPLRAGAYGPEATLIGGAVLLADRVFSLLVGNASVG